MRCSEFTINLSFLIFSFLIFTSLPELQKDNARTVPNVLSTNPPYTEDQARSNWPPVPQHYY